MGHQYLTRKTEPLPVNLSSDVFQLVEKMGGISFQGRNLSTALRVWRAMLQDKTSIFLGISGALIPAGLRNVFVYLIKNRLIDCIVSTGANLFHDCHESLGKFHYLGTVEVNDLELKKHNIDRIYDTFASELEFEETDDYIAKFASNLDSSYPYSTREFFYLLGKKLSQQKHTEGILTSAYKAKVPIYCPAVGDSSVGIAISTHTYKKKSKFLFDLIKDVEETAEMILQSKSTGVIYLGGGTPKNFIQQTEITATLLKKESLPGHKYAIQITADAPHWGGLSGCTFKEAQSWGKIHKEAKMVTIYSDVTLALPILVTALAQSLKRKPIKRKSPKFAIDQKELVIKID